MGGLCIINLIGRRYIQPRVDAGERRENPLRIYRILPALRVREFVTPLFSPSHATHPPSICRPPPSRLFFFFLHPTKFPGSSNPHSRGIGGVSRIFNNILRSTYTHKFLICLETFSKRLFSFTLEVFLRFSETFFFYIDFRYLFYSISKTKKWRYRISYILFLGVPVCSCLLLWILDACSKLMPCVMPSTEKIYQPILLLMDVK